MQNLTFLRTFAVVVAVAVDIDRASALDLQIAAILEIPAAHIFQLGEEIVL